MSKQPKPTVAEFINSIDNETRQKDGRYLMDLMKRITGAKPWMCGSSIIAYGKFHYTTKSGLEGDIGLLQFSPRKDKLVLYVLNDFKGQDGLLKKLGKHKTGKVCLYLNKLADVDLDVLEEIVQRSYDHVVKEGVSI